MAFASLVRDLTGWPEDVPVTLIDAHLEQARRWALRRAGVAVPLAGPDWDTALAWRAAATALPVLHSFALDGAARVGRLEGNVNWRFMNPNEVDALAGRWQGYADEALAAAAGTAPEEGFSCAQFGMEAV